MTERVVKSGSISWVLRNSWSSTLCVMLHWLSWNSSRGLLRWYAKSIYEAWIDSIRIDLYNDNDRALWVVDLNDHVKDIDSLIVKLTETDTYTKIYVIWHSLWWLIAHLLDWTHISAVIWRDPSLPKIWNIKNKVTSHCDLCITDGAVQKVISKKLVEDLIILWDDYMKNTAIPYLSICSEKVGYFAERSKYVNKSKNQQTTIIEWSSHSFSEFGIQEELYKMTTDWILSLD